MNKKTIFRIFPHICKMVFLLLFTHRYPARCFGMNMPKSRDIQAKIHSIAAGNLEWILATLLWTEWTVTLMPNIKGKYTRIVLTFLLKCDKKRISELNMCNVITQRLHRTWCAKENPVRIRSDTVTVYGSCFSETTGKPGREKQRWSKSGELPWRRI